LAEAGVASSDELQYTKEGTMAKVFASDTAMLVTGDAVQVFGGHGFSLEYPVERMMPDAKIARSYGVIVR
jgi:butyryl-CoA dehydrogenase